MHTSLYEDYPALIYMRVILCVKLSDAKICFAWKRLCFSFGNCELRTTREHLLLWIKMKNFFIIRKKLKLSKN